VWQAQAELLPSHTEAGTRNTLRGCSKCWWSG